MALPSRAPIRCARTPRLLAAAVLAAIPLAAMSAEPAGRYMLTSDKVRLHVLEAGAHGGNGPVLAFVPGWSMPGSIFHRQVASLSRRHPVAVLDPRGQGLSDIPPRGYTTARRAKDIGEFAASYRRIVLVGWSLGALEALEFVHSGDAGRIVGLVLVDSSVGEHPPPKPTPKGGGFTADLRRDRVAALDRFVRDIFRKPPPDDELNALRDQAMRMPLEASLSLFPSKIPRSHWRDIARSFPRPLLYAVTPQFAEQAANLRLARPETRVEVFTDAGHALFADDSERFNALLEEFVATLPR